MQIDGPKQKKGETKKPYFNVINKEHSQTQFGKTKKCFFFNPICWRYRSKYYYVKIYN